MEAGINAENETLPQWMERTVRDTNLDLRNPEDMDRLLLSRKPSQKATRYSRIMAFGNHFRVQDESTERLMSYNSGVASVFKETSEDARESLVNYVGVLKDVLELDYGPVQTPIILLRCEWAKPTDNRGNSMYVRDNAGFLLVNFRQTLPRTADPFIFPSQATQVFFSDVVERPGWKVVLHKESRARREVVEPMNAFMSTTVETPGLIAPQSMPVPIETVNIVGAIELSAQETLLAQEGY